MRTNTLLTIYNKYVDPSTRSEKYQRSLVGKVQWENRKGSNVIASGGQISIDQARIFVPFENVSNYVSPRTWQALADKSDQFTFQVGDVIVKGEVVDAIGDLFTITDLKETYDNVLVISSVDTMDFGGLDLQHWQLGAK